MNSLLSRFTPVLGILLLLAPVAAAQDDADLNARIDVLAEELARLREQMAIPETDAGLNSAYGMGPAASRVYGSNEGISLGGYGEFYYEDRIDGDNTGDMYRFIAYIGYKFSDKLVMNTELEFEHATTSGNFDGKGGSVSVEFSYLDFLLDPRFNVRAGNLLLPMGFINELHEPPFYRGNFRPSVERSIIPSTWRELGAGAHGQLGEDVRYTAYVVNGLNGDKFDKEGVRGGRQKGNRVLFNDVGVVGALNYETARVGAAASAYYGGADHDKIFDGGGDMVDLNNWITEAHAYYRNAGWEFKALVAMSGIDGAEELSPIAGETIPERQLGWYVEAGYDVAPLLMDSPNVRIEPWVRYEDFNLQDEVGDGMMASDLLDYTSITAGVQLLPHSQVVLKAEWERMSDENDVTEDIDELRLGAGFVF